MLLINLFFREEIILEIYFYDFEQRDYNIEINIECIFFFEKKYKKIKK